MASVPAPVLTQRQAARSLKAKTNKPVKIALCTPYKVLWPAVDVSTQDSMLHELKKSFTERNLKNPLGENVLFRRLKKDERRSQKDEYLAKSMQSPEEINLRSQLVVGVTEVTKALENGKLRLVVIDRSSPWQLHRHLAQLSAVRSCPAVALDRASDTLSSLLSVTRMCALGFQVKSEGDSDYFDATVGFIVAKCPPIEVPWLHCEDDLQALKNDAIETKLMEEKGKQDFIETNNKSAETSGNEAKDYSHLYIKKSSVVSEIKPKIKPKSDGCSFAETAFVDDMWGMCKMKFQPPMQPIKSLADDVSSAEKQNLQTSKMKAKRSQKRLYKELNVEEVRSTKKKKVPTATLR